MANTNTSNSISHSREKQSCGKETQKVTKAKSDKEIKEVITITKVEG